MNAFKSYSSFKEMISEIVQTSPSIKEVLTDSEGNLPTTSDEATLILMKKIEDDLPSMFNENYPSVSAFSVNGYEVGYKFPGQLSFGWRTESSMVDGEPTGDIIYKARITVRANPIIAEKTAVLAECSKLGYTLKEKTTPKKYTYSNM